MANKGKTETKSKKTEDVGKISIINRNSWGALPPKSKVQMDPPIREVMYTETDTKTCSTKQECTKLVKDLQKYHMDLKGLPDIEYNFLIGGDGNVYEGRGWYLANELCNKETSGKDSEETANKCLEVAFIGSYKEDEIPQEMKDIADDLVTYGLENDLLYFEQDDGKSEDENQDNPTKYENV